MLRIQTHQVQQFQHLPLFLSLVLCQVMGADTLRHDVIDLLMRIQGSIWILENHLDLTGELEALLTVHGMDILALECNGAAGLGQHTDTGLAAGGLAAAGLAHDTQGLALIDNEGHIIHRLQLPPPACIVIFAQIGHFQLNGTIRHWKHLRSGKKYR